MIQSVPGELSLDNTAILNYLSGLNKAFVSLSEVSEHLKWNDNRSEKNLNQLLTDGMVWIDNQAENGTLYWFPSLFSGCVNSG